MSPFPFGEPGRTRNADDMGMPPPSKQTTGMTNPSPQGGETPIIHFGLSPKYALIANLIDSAESAEQWLCESPEGSDQHERGVALSDALTAFKAGPTHAAMQRATQENEELKREAARLRALLGEAQGAEDTKRLDWLEGATQDQWMSLGFRRPVRHAIDAARATQEREGM